MMQVQEMFVSVYVNDMERAVTFYTNAFGATIEFESPAWSTLVIAGIRLSLVEREDAPTSLGLHLVVGDVAMVCAAVARAGGEIAPAVEGTNGIIIADVYDTEGNSFTLRQSSASTIANESMRTAA